MDEQVLKDLIATSESLNYNWDEIMPKFPELEGVELQVLKDYVETAKANDYNYDVINPKFPELNIKKKDDSLPTGEEEVMVSDTTVVEEPGSSEPSVPETDEVVVEDTEVLETPEPVVQELDDPFENSMQVINLDLMTKNEEAVVPKLEYHFGDYGFKFEEAIGGDRVRAIAPNGEEIVVETDNITDKKDTREGEKLKEFIRANKLDGSQELDLENRYKQNERKFFTDEDVKIELANMNDLAKNQADQIKQYVANKTEFEVLNAQYESMDQAQIDANPEFMQLWSEQKDALDKQLAQLKNQDNLLKLQGAELDRSVGAYYEMKAQTGTKMGAFYNALLQGYSNMSSGLTDLVTDIATYLTPLKAQMGEENYNSEVVKKAIEKGFIKGEEENVLQNAERYIELLEGDQLDEINSEILDENRKGLKYGRGDEIVEQPYSQFAGALDEDMGILQAIREGLVTTVGDDETTREYSDLTKQSFWGGALLGLTESLPAMIGGIGGWAQRTAQMYSQVSDALTKEMENDPTFADVSEAEKAALKLPLGVVVAGLEAVGLRNVIAQKGLANKVLLRVLQKKGADAAGRSFNEVVSREINSMIAKGTLVVTAAGLAEFETGAAQELADIGAKELFNYIKEDEYFKAPENILSEVLYAGAQEAVGGFILGVPGAISTAARKYDFTQLDEGVFEMFEDISKDPAYKDAYVQIIKQAILDGDITKQEGQSQLDAYNEVVNVMNQIPVDFSTEQKKKALGVLLRTQKLEQEIEGKDPRLVKRQKQEIEELNQQLDNILYEETDAIQEPSTKKVDVQESTEDSSQVGEGDTEVTTTQESQEVTEGRPDQTTQEEVTEETKDLQLMVEGEVTEDTEGSTDQDGQVFEQVDEVVSINRASKPPKRTNQFKNFVQKKARRAGKALARIAPDVKIVLHENAEDYFNVTNSRGKGTFVDNTVHINLESADRTTVAHEAFHAILLTKLKTDAAAGRVTKNMMTAISKSLNKDSELKKSIDAFASNYDENIQNEEKLAQIIGEIAAGYKELDAGSKSTLRRWIDRIAKGLGIKVEEFTQTEQDVVNLLNTIAKKVTTGQEIEEGDVDLIEKLQDDDLLNTPPYEGGETLTVNPEGPKDPEPREMKDIYSKIDFATNLPIVSLQEFVNKVGGNLFAVTSDATGLGVDSQGDRIDGGFGYSAITDNLKNGIGFASLNPTFAKMTLSKIAKRFKAGTKIGVMIMVQSPNATLGNYYGGKYLGRALGQIKKSNPNEYQVVVDGVRELLENNKSVKKELDKNTDFNAETILDLVSNPENYTEVEFGKEWIKDTNFEIRRILLNSLFINSQETRTTKQTNPAKLKLKEAGFTMRDFLMEYGDKQLLGENNLKENKGGFVVGGFEMIVPENIDKALAEIDNKGIVHPQFNGKLPSTGNNFLFDGLYPIQENFVEYAKKETAISKDQQESADAAVRKMFKEDKFYKDEFLSGPKKVAKSKRGYTHLKSGPKIRFKAESPQFLEERTPGITASVAKGLGLSLDKDIPTKEAFEKPVAREQKGDALTFQEMETLYDVEQREQKDMPKLTQKQVDEALQSDKVARRIIAEGNQPKQGENVGVRLNLNVFKNTGLPIQAIHQGTKTDAYKRVDGVSGNFRGKVINYAPAVTLKDVYLNTHQKAVYQVKNKIKNKFPLASVDGLYQDIPYDKQDLTGTELRFNPFNTMLFETLDGTPVRSVEEATVYGTRVFARGKIEYFTEENTPTPYEPTKTEKREQKDVKFVIQKKRIYNQTPRALTILTSGYGGKFINLPMSQITISEAPPQRGAYGQDIGESGEMVRITVPEWLFSRNTELEETGGFELETKPKKREQKDVFKKDMSATEIIIAGRDNNFSDASIKEYLTKIRKLKVKEVNELMAIKPDLFSKMPPSFGDVKGGAKVGAKLYSKILKLRAKLEKDKTLSKNEVMDRLIEFLQAQPEYIAEGQKGGLTVQQAKMETELQRETGIRPTKNIGANLRAARQLIRNTNRTKKNLQAIKRELRNFIRKSLPKDSYTKSEVIDMVRKITDADATNIDRLMGEVETFVMKRAIRDLDSKISKILDLKQYTKKSGKRKAAKGVDVTVLERLTFISDFYADIKNAQTADSLGKLYESLLSEFNKLAKKPEPTETEIQKMVDLEILMSLTNAEVMKDQIDANRIDALDKAASNLADLVEFGKTNLKEQINEARQKYLDDFATAYQAIRNDKDRLDMNDPETKEMLRDQEILDAQDPDVKGVQKRLKKWYGGLKTMLGRPFNALMDLSTLMNHIDAMPGDLFGGELQTLVTDRIDASNREFKGRIMLVEKAVTLKLQDIFGKKWKSVVPKLREPKPTGIFIENKAGRKELILSQNQMYYYYNQYKDPANAGKFQKTFGDNYVEIMDQITEQLDPKVKEFADWQVNEFFPSLYNHYNEVYKKIYRTNMPWNQFYAGMLYTQGQKDGAGVLNMLGEGNPYQTSVGTGSTIARQSNNNPILEMDGTDALFTYLRNMEYFSAYAESIRDINKIFTNDIIRGNIKRLYGKDIMGKIDTIIERVASKGLQSQQSAIFINWMNNAFILSRLGLSPLIHVKQMTSVFTYANDIGPLNWLKYGAGLANIPKLVRTWKEMGNNSVYMQDRKYESIVKVLESYSDTAMQEFIPTPVKDKIVNMMMFFIKTGDRNAIMLGGMPNYLYYKDQALKAGKSEQEAIDEAIIKFERDTKRTQQSSDIQDRDVLQTGDPLYRALNMFLTTPKQYMRKEIQAFTNLNRKLMAWDKTAGKGTRGENLRTLAMYHVFMPVLFQWVTNGMPGLLAEWEDEDEADLLRASVIGNLNALFIIGDVFNVIGDVATDKPWAGNPTRNMPIVAVAANIAKQYDRINNIKDPEKKAEATKKMFYEILTLGGIPASNIDKIANNFMKVIEGGESPEKAIMRLLNYSEYQIEGKQKKKKKPKRTTKLTKEEMKMYDPEAYYEMMDAKKEYERENAEYLYQQKLDKQEKERERRQYLDELYGN